MNVEGDRIAEGAYAHDLSSWRFRYIDDCGEEADSADDLKEVLILWILVDMVPPPCHDFKEHVRPNRMAHEHNPHRLGDPRFVFDATDFCEELVCYSVYDFLQAIWRVVGHSIRWSMHLKADVRSAEDCDPSRMKVAVDLLEEVAVVFDEAWVTGEEEDESLFSRCTE